MHYADSEAEMRALMGDLERAMSAASSAIKDQLERARTLVREATGRLDRNFRTLHYAAASQREVLSSAVAAVQANKHEGGLAASSEALLRQFVDEVVRVSCDSMRIIEQLGQLGSRVDSIVGCADSIDGLARETRFIAFNARIETHRAGEAGRTFKVVADEVKRLANASSALSDQIRQNVSDCRVQLSEVNKASTGLANCDMSRAMAAHQQLTESVQKLEAVNGNLGTLLEQIKRDVADALSALEFEAAIGSLLDSAIARIERVGSCALEACRTLEQNRNGNRVAPLREVVRSVRAL